MVNREPDRTPPTDPVPRGRMFASMCLAAGVALLLTSVTEAGWRSVGHLPTADAEDLALWAHHRGRASDGRADTIVVVGKSRAQLDIDVAQIRARFPHRNVIQLALRGRSAYPVFADLATDENFRGRIIMGAVAGDFTAHNRDGQNDAVTFAANAGPDARVNAQLRAHVAEHVTLRSSALPLERVLKNAAHGQWPRMGFTHMDAQRNSRADFSRVDVRAVTGQIVGVMNDAARKMRGQSMDAAQYAREVAPSRALVEQLRARGGDVLLLHLPVTGPSLQFENQLWPRARYWDQLTQLTGANTLHFADVPALASFDCPDSSHLDQKDAPVFTGALLAELITRGFLPAS